MVAQELGGTGSATLSWAEQTEMTEPAPHSLGGASPETLLCAPIQATTGPISAQV